jgi:hypothetical protein
MRGKEFQPNRNNHQGCTVMRSFDYMITLNIESRHWQLLIGRSRDRHQLIDFVE